MPTEQRQTAIAIWLLGVCAMVFAMVVLGGVTRLTHSGLSMVEWKPLTGWLPPMAETEWQALFDKYKQTPEFRQINWRMDLAGFKSIFWLEFIHRVWGRLIGLAFLVPFVAFLAQRRIDRRLAVKLAGLFVLGGLQGLMGWYMVKSGLIDDPDVSHYRLTAHFSLALVIIAALLWVALGLLFPRADPAPRALSRFAAFLALFVFVTALSGGLVAGLDAGFAYNTFPLMGESLVPEALFGHQPWWLSPFEDIATVQFDHRLLAETAFVMVAVLWWRVRGAGLAPRPRRVAHLLLATAAAQVTLGISTLVLVIPIPLAAAHQAGAVTLFAAAVWMAFELRGGR